MSCRVGILEFESSPYREAIGEATENAGKPIPAAFGSRVPNIASEKVQMTTETHSI